MNIYIPVDYAHRPSAHLINRTGTHFDTTTPRSCQHPTFHYCQTKRIDRLRMSSSTSIEGLTKIGQGIHLLRPDNAEAVDHHPSHPTAILLFGWMGAKLPHLQKYITIYRNLYPNSTILLVRSEAAIFWSSESTRNKNLEPAVEALQAIGCIPPTRKTTDLALEPLLPSTSHRVLIHTFSNGGCSQLTTLSNVIAKRNSTTPSTALTYTQSAIIFDSCPGSGGLQGTQRAFSSAVHQPFARFIAKLLITIIYYLQITANFLFRRQTVLQILKARLNDPNLLPWTTKQTPRLYIYSEGDSMIPAEAVEVHIQDAQKAGLNVVRTEKFGKESMHVAHARTDPSRYWAAVERVWKEALELGV